MAFYASISLQSRKERVHRWQALSDRLCKAHGEFLLILQFPRTVLLDTHVCGSLRVQSPCTKSFPGRSSRSVCKGPAHVEQPDWEQCGEWRGSPTGKRKLSPSQPGLCAERLDGKGSASSLRTPHCPLLVQHAPSAPLSGDAHVATSPHISAHIRTGTVGRRGGGKDPREKRKIEEGCSVIETKKGPPKRTFLWAMVSETGLEPVCPFS